MQTKEKYSFIIGLHSETIGSKAGQVRAYLPRPLSCYKIGSLLTRRSAGTDSFARRYIETMVRRLRRMLVHLRLSTCTENSAIFSPDGQWLLTASADTTAKFWSVASCKCLRTFDAHAANVISAAFSEDCEKILTADFSFVIRVWSTKSGRCQLTIESRESGLSLKSAVFSSNSRQVLTTSDDRKTRVWCTETGRCLFTFEGHDGPVTAAAFISDGQQVLTASTDKRAKLWSAVSGKCLLTLDDHSFFVTCVSERPKTGALGIRESTDTEEEPLCKQRKCTHSSSLAPNSVVCISP